MADIFHQFRIKALPEAVYKAISTPAGVDQWWSKNCTGGSRIGEIYELDFGPGYHWKAKVSKAVINQSFEWTMLNSDKDWRGTKVGFQLSPAKDHTVVLFYHTGWPKANEYHNISSYCWAMYMRILKRYLEHGEEVPYEERLEV